MSNFENTFISVYTNDMLEAKKRLCSAKTDKEKTYFENKCEDLVQTIDSEVYKL